MALICELGRVVGRRCRAVLYCNDGPSSHGIRSCGGLRRDSTRMRGPRHSRIVGDHWIREMELDAVVPVRHGPEGLAGAGDYTLIGRDG